MKLVKSLHQKKYRDQHGLFMVEGVKLVGEAIHEGAKIEMIAHACEANELPYELPDHSYRVSQKDLERMSALKTPNRILAVCEMRPLQHAKPAGWSLALDRISDPGNLGTILRICDWFGVNRVLCDPETVELYNPKVVQASMGSIFRVGVEYRSLIDFVSENPNLPVYGADMDGESLYRGDFPAEGILVMGSEAHGLQTEIRNRIDRLVSIPKVGGGESLNVAVSTGIILSHLRSRT